MTGGGWPPGARERRARQSPWVGWTARSGRRSRTPGGSGTVGVVAPYPVCTVGAVYPALFRAGYPLWVLRHCHRIRIYVDNSLHFIQGISDDICCATESHGGPSVPNGDKKI